jgi:hypothetical protein
MRSTQRLIADLAAEKVAVPNLGDVPGGCNWAALADGLLDYPLLRSARLVSGAVRVFL